MISKMCAQHLSLFLMVNPSCHDRDVTKTGLLLNYLCKLRPADYTIMICINLVKQAC